MGVPQKIKIELPYDPAILLLSIYPSKMKILRYMHTPIFIAALFTIAKIWKQFKCPSVDEERNYDIHTCTGILLMHKKKNEILPFGQHGWTLRVLC